MNYNYNILNAELENNNINLSVSEMEKQLFQLGHEVEETFTYKNDMLVVGQIKSFEKHPNADKLNVCQVDLGTEIVQIVCGAPNVTKDAYVIVAKVGCELPELTIKETTIRDMKSQGMMCALNELGIDSKYLTDEDVAGIFLFSEQHKLGSSALKAIGYENIIYDVSLTANRGDCLNYNGMLRDLFAVNNKYYEAKVEAFTSTIKNSVTTVINDGAYSFHNLNISISEITQSPITLRTFLINHNIKPQNVVVDCANMTMLQTGIPIHTYDYDKLDGNFIIETLTSEEKFVGLDEKERMLKAGTLVVKDQSKICAVASIMGSDFTKITDDTKEIIVEIGNFDPVLVRKSGSNFSNKTDALMRGEKGIDSNAIELAFNQFVSNLLKYSSSTIELGEIDTVIKETEQQKYMQLDFSEIQIVLGITLDEDLCLQILSNLGFNKTEHGFTIPSWRKDIENDHDLIEELIRVYNLENIEVYKNIKTFIPDKSVITSNKATLERELEKLLLLNNLNQVVTYSLVSQAEASMFGVDSSKLLSILQPLSSQREFYRGSLLNSLLQVHDYNYSRNLVDSNIFEIANTYHYVDDETVSEKLLVAGLVSGLKSQFINEVTTYSFYDLKLVCEQIANYFNVQFEYVPFETDSEELNRYASATIKWNGQTLGLIGEVHPKLVKQQTFVFELDITSFIDSGSHIKTYQKIYTEPTMTRDITIDVQKSELASNTYKVFNNLDYLIDYQLINIYEHPENDLKSLTFKLSFNDINEKLSSEAVDKVIQQVVNNIKENNYGFKE